MAIALAILSALGLAGMALSAVTWFYAATSAQRAEKRIKVLEDRLETARRETQAGIDAVAAEVRDIEQPSQMTILPAAPRPGMNLSKRTQVLRLHRRGASPEQIASELEIPFQEVCLLLKIHKIVIGTIGT